MSQSTVGGLTPAAQELAKALASFRLLPLQIRLRARETMRLPPYKGSTIRGAFGSVFRRIACSMPGVECRDCQLRTCCPYSYIFETFGPDDDTGLLQGYEAIPRPYVIDPPLEERGIYEAGEFLEFGLTLIGRTIDYLAYFAVAFRHLGEEGMGADRGRFEVDKITAIGGAEPVVVQSESDTTVRFPAKVVSAEEATQAFSARFARLDQPVRIEFLTPVRLVHQRRLVDSVTFPILVRQVLRRTSTLLRYHHGVSLSLDFRDWIERADSVRTLRNASSWNSWRRYSSRQKGIIRMGGITGDVVAEGSWADFAPLLALGEYVHAGKAATFGQGRFRCTAANDLR